MSEQVPTGSGRQKPIRKWFNPAARYNSGVNTLFTPLLFNISGSNSFVSLSICVVGGPEKRGWLALGCHSGYML